MPVCSVPHHCAVLELPGDGGYPPMRLYVPATVRVPAIPDGTVFVPGTAGTRVSLTSSSTSTSHVTHLMLITLSASILIIVLVLTINITFTNRR